MSNLGGTFRGSGSSTDGGGCIAAGPVSSGEAKKKKNKKNKKNKAPNSRVERAVEKQDKAAVMTAEVNAYLMSEDGGFMEAEAQLERTGKVTQGELVSNVALSVGQQALTLQLDQLGPYGVDWSRNGRYLLLAGAKGHLSLLNVQKPSLETEVTVNETVRDACFLHNESLFAAAQRKHVYIYDRDGVELHCLRNHVEPARLAYLPYHFLLASVGRTGYLKYQDVSTGLLVAEHRTRLGACEVLCHNSSNAVAHCGHGNGTVTLWSPALSTPLVKMLCHRGPVGAVCVDPSGSYMCTAGVAAEGGGGGGGGMGNGGFKVWDLRMYREVHAYRTARPVTSMEVSQRGLLAVGFGSHVQVWRDALRQKAKSPYLRHELPGSSVTANGRGLRWRPYEDSLGLGKADGFAALVVPGAGEAHYDALEANPFESKKERREGEVQQLLDKLPPETIVLSADSGGGVGAVDSDAVAAARVEAEAKAATAAAERAREQPAKKRMRGRSKIGTKLRKKRKNIFDEERKKLQERLGGEKDAKQREREQRKADKKSKENSGQQHHQSRAHSAPSPSSSVSAEMASLTRFIARR